jgi:hypothetical protein
MDDPKELQESLRQTARLLTAEQLDKLKSKDMPGFGIEIMPSETEDDVSVAAAAFVLAIESSGVPVNASSSTKQAQEVMQQGGAVVKITFSQDVSPSTFFEQLNS